MNILDDLWHGKIYPAERAFRGGSRYAKLMKAGCEYESRFCAELSPEGKEAYKAFYNVETELSDIVETDAFIQGFRLGAQIILAALGEYDTPLPWATAQSS